MVILGLLDFVQGKLVIEEPPLCRCIVVGGAVNHWRDDGFAVCHAGLGYYFLYKFVLVELKVVLGVSNAYTQVFVVVDIMERTDIISHHRDDFFEIFNIGLLVTM